MCGIVGAMSSILNEPEKEVFKGLLNIASFRGRDGSGVLLVGESTRKKPTPEVRCIRSKLISGWLAYSPEVEAAMSKPVTIALGHARWPTRGGNDIKNLHPHRSKHIVGVHNGTMYDICGQKVPDNASDSALLFQVIEEKGIEEAWKTSSGAAALIYVDEQEQTLNFIRNSARPLMFRNYGWGKNISTLFWASERGMLDFVAQRHMHSQNFWDTYLPENILFTFPLEVDNPIRAKTTDLKKPAVPYKHVSAIREYLEGDYIDPNEDVALPFDGGRFNTGVINQTVKQRAEAARRRLAERVAEQKTQRAREEASKSAPPFHPRNGTNSATPTHLPAVIDHRAFPNSILNDPVPDFTPRASDLFSGKKCCWCGSSAEPGDKIIPIFLSDAGGIREFVCHDCSRNPDVISGGFVTGKETTLTVSN